MKNINVKNTGYVQMLSWNAMIAVRTAHKHMSTCCYPNILCFMTLPLSLLISAFGQTLQLENSLVWKTFWCSSIPLFPNVFSVYTNIESHLSGLHVDRLLYSYSIKCLRTLGRLTTNWELRYPLDASWPSIIKKNRFNISVSDGTSEHKLRQNATATFKKSQSSKKWILSLWLFHNQAIKQKRNQRSFLNRNSLTPCWFLGCPIE